MSPSPRLLGQTCRRTQHAPLRLVREKAVSRPNEGPSPAAQGDLLQALRPGTQGPPSTIRRLLLLFLLFRLTPGRDAVIHKKLSRSRSCMLEERMEVGVELPRPICLLEPPSFGSGHHSFPSPVYSVASRATIHRDEGQEFLPIALFALPGTYPGGGHSSCYPTGPPSSYSTGPPSSYPRGGPGTYPLGAALFLLLDRSSLSLTRSALPLSLLAT